MAHRSRPAENHSLLASLRALGSRFWRYLLPAPSFLRGDRRSPSEPRCRPVHPDRRRLGQRLWFPPERCPISGPAKHPRRRRYAYVGCRRRSENARLLSSIELELLLSAPWIDEPQTEITNKTLTATQDIPLRCIELVDETTVVDGAKIMQIPWLHRPDVSHRRIFADIEVIDVLNGAGQGIRFL